ncbi:MAG: hypothetical protein ACI867_000970 [Glaciecola sp.]|jgi:hypothetical protein
MSAAFLVLALAHALIVGWLAVRWLRHPVALQPAILIVMAVGAALVVDNLVVGLGSTIGEGDLLSKLNSLRFLLHVVITPTIIVAAVLYGQAGGIDFTSRLTRPAQLLAAAMVLLGIATDGLWPRLEPAIVSDVVRYVHPDAVVPLPSIVAVVAVIVIGGALWKADVSRWMLTGAVIMFVASAIPPGDLLLLGNIAEVAFLAGLAATAMDLSVINPTPSAV